MTEFSKAERLKGKTIGFVPTMGALHEGHLSLIRKAHKENDLVVVSIFVNPTQFAPHEDFKKYPRNLKHDAKLCQEEGADVIFAPDVRQIYPPNYRTYVTVEGLSEVLCGKFRPGHFKGVATVVTKLFNIVAPRVAYFGQKDAQQAIIIKKMAQDLNLPVKVKIMPTIRERDGLAMSSRNYYLNKDERKDAAILYQALRLAKNLIRQGKRDPRDIIHKMKRIIDQKKNSKIQYVSIVDLRNLNPVNKIRGKVLIALAVFIGKARLIDNILVNPNDKAQNPK
jgi:pantoate--beta-alanine ligase